MANKPMTSAQYYWPPEKYKLNCKRNATPTPTRKSIDNTKYCQDTEQLKLSHTINCRICSQQKPYLIYICE
jgi:hypothetical protein